MSGYTIHDATFAVSFHAVRSWPVWVVVGRISIAGQPVEFTLKGEHWRRSSAERRATTLGNAITLAAIDAGKTVRPTTGRSA